MVCTQGVIDAMSWFSLAQTDRHRLRLCGRPFLALLHEIVATRRRIGGPTQFTRFVSAEASPYDKAGMKLAKLWACRGESQRGDAKYSLPPQASERFISLSINSKPVFGRVRSAVAVQIQRDVVRTWHGSRSQARFAGDHATAFIRDVRCLIADGLLQPPLLGFSLRLVTDTVHFALVVDDDERSFSSTPCPLCDEAPDSDVSHIFTCDNAGSCRARTELVQKLLDLLSAASASSSWVLQLRGMPLMYLIRRLFSAFDYDLRLRLAFGGFSSVEFVAAATSVGVSNAVVRRDLAAKMRTALLMFAYEEWRRRSG